MNFQETDINFEKIDWRQFEELCFDLLMKYQFHDLIWHQGSADEGRDIEGLFTVVNSLMGPYSEQWFFECKYYSSGVPMNEMVSKIGWAEAHRVKHFVLMTNTHPTKSTWDYLNRTQLNSHYKIHVIDGKAIKRKLLAFPDLIVKYFADDTVVWVKNLVRIWVFQDALPDLKTLYKLSKQVEPEKLNKEELLFLFMAFHASDYDEDFLDDEIEPFSFDFMLPEIKKYRNNSYPIDMEKETGYPERSWGNLAFMSSRTQGNDKMYFAYQDTEDKHGALQLFLMRSDRQLSAKITYSIQD
jgi:hypothetical protein